MDQGEDFLKRLEKLKQKESERTGVSKAFRESYQRRVKDQDREISHREVYDRAADISMTGLDNYRKYSERMSSDLDLQALAKRTMELAKEDDYIGGAINAAYIYDGIGKGNIGVSKLLAVVEKAAKDGKLDDRSYQNVKVFIEKHPGKREPKPSGIEGKTMVFICSLFAGIVLSLISIRPTGNAIGSITGTAPGLFGIFLFVFGLAGLFFSRKK